MRQNRFDAEQLIYAAYLMTESSIGDRIKVVLGARYEGTEMFVFPEDSTLFDPIIAEDSTATPGELSLKDFLPAANMIYAINEDMNLRFGYSRTLARPNIMEFSQLKDFLSLAVLSMKETQI